MSDAIQSPVFDHKPCPSSFYNQLPHIDIASKEVVEHLHTRDYLLGMIARAGLMKVFSVHLIHKHFDVPDGQSWFMRPSREEIIRRSRSAAPESLKLASISVDISFASPRPA